jgi:Uma2 family endonuclease
MTSSDLSTGHLTMAIPVEFAGAGTWTRERVIDLIAHSPGPWPRYELINGELLTTPAPSAAHERAQSLLFATLYAFIRAHGCGILQSAPADISLDGVSLVQPDLFVIPRRTSRSRRDWRDLTSLLLVVEILSPETERADRDVKRRHYMRCGVSEYWIVDLAQRRIERWRPAEGAPEILFESLTWQAEAAVPPLRIELGPLFDAALRGS